MSEKLSFLIRRLPNNPKNLPRKVAVVSISINAKSPHYVFEECHHSLAFHPQVNRQLAQIPTKHRHVSVTLNQDQINTYLDPLTRAFRFNGQPLRLWSMSIDTLTGNLEIYSNKYRM